MDATAYLTHLRRDLDAVRACLGGDLGTPVEHCGGWTLHDLAEHLGRGNLWTVTAVTEQRGDHRPPPAPREPEALVRWFAGTSDTLLDALDTDPSAPAWTFAPPRTVGFWQRRRCLEALVHRWDAEHACGPVQPLDPELADDGVAEVLDTMAPRQVARGRAPEPTSAVRLVATDTGGAWAYGPGAPVATVRGTAGDLLLLLWRRLPAEDPRLAWEGDRAAAGAVLTDGLVP